MASQRRDRSLGLVALSAFLAVWHFWAPEVIEGGGGWIDGEVTPLKIPMVGEDDSFPFDFWGPFSLGGLT